MGNRIAYSSVGLRIFNIALISVIAIATQSCAPPHKAVERTAYANTPIDTAHVIVRFSNNSTRSARMRALSAAGVAASNNVDLVPGLALATVPSGQTVDQTITALSQDSSVLYAEPDFILTPNLLPNDTRFSSQWGLNNTGQTGGKVDADIDAPEAWDLTTGKDVVIAVIDTGVDYNHVDLVSNIWTNTREIPGNGIDDDGNGFVDDVRGWNFVDNNNDPLDLHNHGTHVAGIIAGSGNNGAGVVGVNWQAKIMALRFMDASGAGRTSDAIRAIEYAVRNGARISNNSWGGPTASRSLSDAISAANSAGHLFVTAAGNVGADIDASPEYPAAFALPNIISVASTDANDNLSGFSNFGAVGVDLAAPGSQILSTVRNNRYGTLSGTSMAAPFVAGAAGLVLAQNPGLNVTQLKDALLKNVDPLTVLQGKMVSGGRLNVFKAVSAVSAAAVPQTNIAPLALNALSVQVVVGGSQTLTASGGTAPYTWTTSDSTIVSISSTGVVTAISAGSATITVTDAVNRQVTISAVVSPLPPRNIQVTTTVIALNVGQSIGFSATGGIAPYTWQVSNPLLASIDSNGVLTAQAAGGITVSATDKDGFTGTSKVVTLLAVTANSTPTPPAVQPTNPVTPPPSTATPAPPTGAGGGLLVVSSSDIVSTFNTLRISANTGKPPFTWALSNASAGSIFPDQLSPNVAWYTAGSIANISTTVQVTDANGSSGASASISIVNAVK